MRHTSPLSIGHMRKVTHHGVNNAYDFNELSIRVGEPGVNGGQGNVVATVHMGGPGAASNSPESLTANARLFCAAPDLHEACMNAVGFLSGTSILAKEQLQQRLVEALKKAGVS